MAGSRLILNADDFGLTRGVNRAVAELYVAGALSSATLMANGAAFGDAVAIALAHPGLGIGCHVVLTDGVPLSRPKDIPSLLGPDGQSFRPSLAGFLLAVLAGRVREDEMALEAAAQVQRLQEAGIAVTHLDTHKHTHILPGVARPLLAVAERAGIGAVRNPFEQNWSLAVSHSDPVRRLQVQLMAQLRKRFKALPQIQSGAVQTTDGTVGISATGRLDEPSLRALMAAMPEGVWETVCHPGYSDTDLDTVRTRLRGTRDVEREALLAVFGQEAPNPQLPRPELIHYRNLSPAYGSIGAHAR